MTDEYDTETAHALVRELEAAARLHQLETAAFAAAKMRALLDEIAIELKGVPPPAGHKWSDLPGLVRKLVAIRPPPSPDPYDEPDGGKRRNRNAG